MINMERYFGVEDANKKSAKNVLLVKKNLNIRW